MLGGQSIILVILIAFILIHLVAVFKLHTYSKEAHNLTDKVHILEEELNAIHNEQDMLFEHVNKKDDED